MSVEKASMIRSLLFLSGFVLFLTIEFIAPYRPPTTSKFRRILINLGMTGVNNIVLSLMFSAATLSTIRYVT